jgi:hypothetical protein
MYKASSIAINLVQKLEVMRAQSYLLNIVSYSKRCMGVALTYHSFGGITLTMPDFMPYLSILSTNFLKLLNWSIVYYNAQYKLVNVYAKCALKPGGLG